MMFIKLGSPETTFWRRYGNSHTHARHNLTSMGMGVPITMLATHHADTRSSPTYRARIFFGPFTVLKSPIMLTTLDLISAILSTLSTTNLIFPPLDEQFPPLFFPIQSPR